MAVVFNPFSGTFDFTGSGGGSGVSNFADLLDLTTASVTEINIKSNSDGIIWKSEFSASKYSSHYSYSDTSDQYAGMDARSTTQAGFLEVKADETNATSYFSESGALEVYNATYSGATTDLLGGYSHHVFTADPTGSVKVNKAKQRDLFYVTNKSGVSVTLAQNTAETFNGATSFVCGNGNSYLFIAARAGGIYKVFSSVLSGDVTTVGSVATIANDAVTYAKMQNVSATDKVLGRSTAGSGDVEEIACTSFGRALIDDTSVAAQVTTLGLDNTKIASIGITIDGGGSAITTGVKGYIEIPYACTINRATLLADQSGSIVIDVWKDTYANYPPTVADTITASAKPTISTATKSQDSTLTGWTTSVSAGDILGFNVDSITTCTRVHLILKVTKT